MAGIAVPQGQAQGQRIVRAQRAEAVRPFHQGNAGGGIVPAQFVEGVRAVQPPEVEMRHRAERRFIGLNQGEAGAWHVQIGVAGQATQKGPGEGGFASAEFAFQQNRVPRPHLGSNARGKAFRGGEVGEIEADCIHRNSVPPGRIRGQPVPARGIFG